MGTLSRGPYLQHADSGVTVVWYTNLPTDGRVRWSAGEDRSGEVVSSSGVATRHEAVIPSLPPGERCTYRVYSSRGLLAGQGGVVEFSFRAPEAEVLRFVAFGDSGTGSPEQFAVARAIGAEAAPPDLVMIVGDVNQIPDGTTDYDSRFFAPYRELLPAIPFYALMGNHDYEVERGRALLDVFTLPRNGPPGLVPETSCWLERAGALMIVHDTNQTPATLRDHSALARAGGAPVRDVPPRLPAPHDVRVRAERRLRRQGHARSWRRSTRRPGSTSCSTATTTCTSAPAPSTASCT